MSDVSKWVEHNTILCGTVGSTVHGVAMDGTDDLDQMGVTIEPKRHAIGFQGFEQYQYRTAWERTGTSASSSPQPKSAPGDLDLTIYSLRKWARLALFKANPTALVLLFIPPESCQVRTEWGEWLQALAPSFASKQAAKSFLGYLTDQRERLEGKRGQKDVNRRDLEEAHGYDTKYAMHAARLGLQGCEYLRTGRLTLPMQESDRLMLLSIRRGELSLPTVLTTIRNIEDQLVEAKAISPLPAKPDVERVERFIIEAYEYVWWRDDANARGKTVGAAS